MLQWLIRFAEINEFNESSAPFMKNSNNNDISAVITAYERTLTVKACSFDNTFVFAECERTFNE